MTACLAWFRLLLCCVYDYDYEPTTKMFKKNLKQNDC